MPVQGPGRPVRTRGPYDPLPALELFQTGADGLDRRPAVKTVGRVSGGLKPAVSGHGPAQETPEGHAAFESGQLAGEVAEALL